MGVRSASGQILVLVLLIILVAMTIGLSVASRTLNTVRNQAELTQSNRAFSSAEAGIEKALLTLKQNGSCANNACSSGIEGENANVVTVTQAGGTGEAYYFIDQGQDALLSVNLNSYTGSHLKIYWGTNGDSANCNSNPSSVAAILGTFVYERGGQYGVSKFAVDPCSNRASGNGFSPLSSVSGGTDPSESVSIPADKTLPSGGFGFVYNAAIADFLNGGDVLIGLRLRLLYSSGPLAVLPYDGGSAVTLPTQGEYITSTAVVGGQQRTVKAVRSVNAVPAIFDYALFNGSTSTLSK